MSADADAAVVRGLYEARARGDLEAAAGIPAPKTSIWHEPYEYLGSLNGRDGGHRRHPPERGSRPQGTFKLDASRRARQRRARGGARPVLRGAPRRRMSGKEVGIVPRPRRPDPRGLVLHRRGSRRRLGVHAGRTALLSAGRPSDEGLDTVSGRAHASVNRRRHADTLRPAHPPRRRGSCHARAAL